MACVETIIDSGRVVYRDCHSHRPVSQKTEPPARGPGTELKKILAGWPLRIVASPNCSCNAKARTMDARGCDWCEQNIDTIVGWLREEAAKRKLPFLDAVGKVLVRRAVQLARKDQQRGTHAQTGGEGSPTV